MDYNFDREIQLMECLPIMVCLADLEKDALLFCNEEGRRIIGEDYKEMKLSRLFGSNIEFRAYVNNWDAAKKEHLTYGQMINGKWLMITVSTYKPEEAKSVVIITANDVTSFKKQGYFDSVIEKDPHTGIYNKQTGLHFLESYVSALGSGGDYFTLAYIRLENVPGSGGDKDGYRMGFSDAVKNTIRGTDIFAIIEEDEYMILFPKCTFEVAGNILATLENKLELASSTQDLFHPFQIAYSLLEVNKDNAGSSEAILHRAKALLG